METFRYSPGDLPLLVSMPHVGTYLPDALAARMTQQALVVPDTDWHVDQLYDFLGTMGASVIQATHSRYVIDLNRDPAGLPLYAGANNTELCPTSTFDEGPIYRSGEVPEAAEIEERRAVYWQPYHDRLAGELDALLARHGRVLLWDAHSIRSRVPRFFEGRLPDLNLGSGGGVTAARPLLQAVAAVGEASSYRQAVDGRFKGGYITRHYGQPEAGRHALQMELSWATYMDEDPPFGFREDLASDIRPVLQGMLEAGVKALDMID